MIPHDARSKEPGDQLPETTYAFDFMLSNPPFGVTSGGKDGYEAEARHFETTRYQAGMPRVNDGALLFLQTILAKMKSPEKGGSRVAIVFNGSPLSNGDCGSGESEIRRWILEHDWLDAIVMMPDQLFYNTGIYTYIRLLRNDKPPSHRGRVMLIDARAQFEKEPKAFASKRNRMTDAHREWIEERCLNGWSKDYSDPHVKVFKNTKTEKAFAYHKVDVVFWQTDEMDQPSVIFTEPCTKPLSTANLTKGPSILRERSDVSRSRQEGQAQARRLVEFVLKPGDNAAKKLKTALDDRLSEVVSVEWTHRHYIRDDEYIPFGEDIATFFLNARSASPSSVGRIVHSSATRSCRTSISIGTSRPLLQGTARRVLETGKARGEDVGRNPNMRSQTTAPWMNGTQAPDWKSDPDSQLCRADAWVYSAPPADMSHARSLRLASLGQWRDRYQGFAVVQRSHQRADSFRERRCALRQNPAIYGKRQRTRSLRRPDQVSVRKH